MRLQSAIFTIEDTLAGHDDAGKVLSILKMEGVWLYAVTELSRDEAELLLHNAELADCFRGILTTKEAGCSLADGRIYEKAMRRLRSTLRDTIVFTGHLSSLRAAKGALFRVAAVAGAAGAAEWDEMKVEASEVVERYADFLA